MLIHFVSTRGCRPLFDCVSLPFFLLSFFVYWLLHGRKTKQHRESYREGKFVDVGKLVSLHRPPVLHFSAVDVTHCTLCSITSRHLADLMKVPVSSDLIFKFITRFIIILIRIRLERVPK